MYEMMMNELMNAVEENKEIILSVYGPGITQHMNVMADEMEFYIKDIDDKYAFLHISADRREGTYKINKERVEYEDGDFFIKGMKDGVCDLIIGFVG